MSAVLCLDSMFEQQILDLYQDSKNLTYSIRMRRVTIDNKKEKTNTSYIVNFVARKG